MNTCRSKGLHRRKAQHFRSIQKDQKRPHRVLDLIEDEVKALKILAKERLLSLEEGKTLYRLATKARNLRRKLYGPNGSQENCDAQNIP